MTLTSTSKTLRLSLAAALIAGIVLAFHSAPIVRAATISVNTTTDDNTVNGNCTLREAIIAANTDAAVDACPAGSGADTITLASAATYSLSISVADASIGATGLPRITSAIILQGNGSTIRRASGTFRILRINSGATLTLDNVTIRDGLAEVVGGTARGGGIYNRGTLTLTNNSAVRSNSIQSLVNDPTALSAFGGGIFSEGVLIISNSTVSNNTIAVLNGTGSALGFGGGIYASGTVTLTESDIGDNSLEAFDGLGGSDSAAGGGLYVSESTLLTITDTTIRNNQAVGSTGASGGGVFAVSATLTMTGSTVTGNTATGNDAATGGTVGGGMTLNGSTTATIVNSTISGNSAAGSAGNNGGGSSTPAASN